MMMQPPKEVQDLMAQMWGDIQRSSQQLAIADAKVNPDKYRLNRTMNINSNYRYYDGGWLKATKTRLEHYTFCWSVNTNIGGQYLTWVEVAEHTPKGKWKQTRRIRWSFSDSKKDIMNTALRRRNNWRIDRPEHLEYQPR